MADAVAGEFTKVHHAQAPGLCSQTILLKERFSCEVELGIPCSEWIFNNNRVRDSRRIVGERSELKEGELVTWRGSSVDRVTFRPLAKNFGNGLPS